MQLIQAASGASCDDRHVVTAGLHCAQGSSALKISLVQQQELDMSVGNKHPHYHKDVSNLQTVDVYRVLALFNVTDPCIQHAVKKLLVAGGRGAGKDIGKDVQEAIDSLERFKEMRVEDTVGRDRFQP